MEVVGQLNCYVIKLLLTNLSNRISNYINPFVTRGVSFAANRLWDFSDLVYCTITMDTEDSTPQSVTNRSWLRIFAQLQLRRNDQEMTYSLRSIVII